MTTVLNHLEDGVYLTAQRNKGVLEFVRNFVGGDNTTILNRWEIWLQIEMLLSLNNLKVKDGDLIHENKHKFKLSKSKSKSASKHGRTSGSIDFAFRPRGGHGNLFAAVELKVKNDPSQAIQGGLYDLLKLRAFKTTQWNFRAIYAMCVYTSDPSKPKKSKYVDFVMAQKDGRIIPFGEHFQIALLGWEAKPHSGDNKDFYSEYSEWAKETLRVAKSDPHNLTINQST